MSPVRRGEVRPGALLAAHLFLSVASTVMGKAARDAIFLSRFSPQQMTAIDIAAMLAAAAAVGCQLRLSVRLPIRRVLLFSPLCFAFGDVVLWCALSAFPGVATIHAAYLWIAIEASLYAPQASVLACQILTLRQAKRLCGLIGAGAILGWIGGGLLAQALAARFGALSLLLGAAALRAFCPIVVTLVWRDMHEGGAFERPRLPAGLRRSAITVWGSPHLRAIAGLALVSSIATTIVGFQFRAMASRSIDTSDHLAAFFGSFSFHAGLVALVLQVFLTRRIVGSLGLGLALMIAPSALAAGSLGILFSGTLAAAVALKGSDQVLRYSVDRTAVEILYRPLSRAEILESKTFIDALISRLGDAAGGLIAFAGAAVLHLSFSWLSVISLALVFGWLTMAALARRQYRSRLRDNLRGLPTRSREVCASDGGALYRRQRRRRGRSARDILSPDPEVRLETLRSLAGAGAERPRAQVARKTLMTALAAEIVGFAMLVEPSSLATACQADASRTVRDTVERVARLLYLIAPDQYPDSIRAALAASDPVMLAAALEYLDVTLPGPHRRLLVSLLDRGACA